MKNIINFLNEFWQSAFRWPVIIVLAFVFLLGLMMGGGPGESPAKHDHAHEGAAAKDTMYTCSMHPQVRQPKPGKCPLCFMDLIPVSGDESEQLGPGQLKLSPAAMKLANIQTAAVERKFVAASIRMVGKVEADETRIGSITARMPGRIDRLFVDYTGVAVRKGDHLVSLYSPQLITAQQELLQALKNAKRFRMGSSNVNAAREKLKLWGLTPGQIEAIGKRGKPLDHLTIYSPTAGIVIKKHASEGTYVKTGSPIYTIVDLDKVWVKLDAYESDLSWLRFGQRVMFETEAFPGEFFEGKIAFIDPVLTPETRTVKVRVNVDNSNFQLKPGMFVRGVVKSKLALSGKVMDPELAGKWISPMHPEVVKDKPGVCDVCGMPLVKAEDLGYVTADAEQQEAPLVIPASAPLITGTRAVVYVAVRGKEGVFEGKEIILGPRAGNYYIVKAGLEEGERVVTNGAFKIDSDLQIQAKRSMMSVKPEPPVKSEAGVPEVFRESMDGLVESYFGMQRGLSGDSLERAQVAAKGFKLKLDRVDMKLLSGRAHMDWMKQLKKLNMNLQLIIKAGDIEAARVPFSPFSDAMIEALKSFGTPKSNVTLFHCPMALDNVGAYWLQDNTDTKNPYFGASMLICKDLVEPLFKKKIHHEEHERHEGP